MLVPGPVIKPGLGASNRITEAAVSVPGWVSDLPISRSSASALGGWSQLLGDPYAALLYDVECADAFAFIG